MSGRRGWALLSLLLLTAAAALAVALAVIRFPRGLTVLALLVLAGAAAWYGVRRRDSAQIAGLVIAGLAAAGAVVLIIVEGRPLQDAIIAACVLGALEAARRAFRVHVELPAAAAPTKPVLLYNPRSGDGKAAKFNLAEEGPKRGMETIELKPGDDLEQLARDAVARGADGLAMAGGDGSQALIATIAAEHGLPYACIPAGTRNHFALDLGVDRDDVVGALDAFVDGGEKVVDLAEVNGRVFVNNVSLGLYARAVQEEGYRDAKIRTILQTVPDVIGPDATPPSMTWQGEHGRETGVALLVANNQYRLGRAISAGTRPRIDEGVLGMTVFAPGDDNPTASRGRLAWRQWTAPTFEIDADQPVPAGVDGEALTFDPPLRFVSRPGALRVRIARQHPGASPSSQLPDSPWQAVVAVARMALTRSG